MQARASLTIPPSDLSRFPSAAITSHRRLWRIHQKDPWWFCSDGKCRFDLPPPEGTCYVAPDPLGSFIEKFRDLTLIDLADIRRYLISEMRLARPIKVADCTSPRARSFGCTGEIHSTTDYELTQAWAKAFRNAGFGGVRYYLRHDPSMKLIGIAIFGPVGKPAGWPKPETVPIEDDLLARAAKHFGIRVIPAP